MSDTYGSVQQDAQRSLAINRAWIVARVEHNSLLARVSRSTYTCVLIMRCFLLDIVNLLGPSKKVLQEL